MNFVFRNRWESVDDGRESEQFSNDILDKDEVKSSFNIRGDIPKFIKLMPVFNHTRRFEEH